MIFAARNDDHQQPLVVVRRIDERQVLETVGPGRGQLRETMANSPCCRSDARAR